MDRQSNELGAMERMRWLAELAGALEEAQEIALQLGVSDGDDSEAKSLYARLEAARIEVDALRRGRWTGSQQQLDPIWMGLLARQARIGSPDEPGTECF